MTLNLLSTITLQFVLKLNIFSIANATVRSLARFGLGIGVAVRGRKGYCCKCRIMWNVYSSIHPTHWYAYTQPALVRFCRWMYSYVGIMSSASTLTLTPRKVHIFPKIEFHFRIYPFFYYSAAAPFLQLTVCSFSPVAIATHCRCAVMADGRVAESWGRGLGRGWSWGRSWGCMWECSIW